MTNLADVADITDPVGPATDVAARELLGLRVDPARGYAELLNGPGLLNSNRRLWGGAGLAAAIAATEQVLARPAVWATVQYISPIEEGERLALRVEVLRQGRGLSQALVRGEVDGRLALIATGTFGASAREAGRDADRQVVTPPVDVVSPDEGKEPGGGPGDGMRARIEQRWGLATRPGPAGTPGAGRCALWLRMREPVPLSAVTLSVLADFAPAGLSVALGVPTFGLSLDNSIRVSGGLIADPGGTAAPGNGWVLLDVEVATIARGVAQLHARMFDENGRLLATAGQSAVIRAMRRPS